MATSARKTHIVVLSILAIRPFRTFAIPKASCAPGNGSASVLLPQARRESGYHRAFNRCVSTVGDERKAGGWEGTRIDDSEVKFWIVDDPDVRFGWIDSLGFRFWGFGGWRLAHLMVHQSWGEDSCSYIGRWVVGTRERRVSLSVSSQPVDGWSSHGVHAAQARRIAQSSEAIVKRPYFLRMAASSDRPEEY